MMMNNIHSRPQDCKKLDFLSKSFCNLVIIPPIQKIVLDNIILDMSQSNFVFFFMIVVVSSTDEI